MQTVHLKSVPRPSRGFTMIEILVGMAIAMLGILVMTQMFAQSEGQKRATTGGNDAQASGAIALFRLQREIAEAGWGTSDPKLLGCDVVLRAGLTLSAFAPVTINHSIIPATIPDANTDTLLIAYGSTMQSPEGDQILDQPAGFGNKQYQMATPSAFQSGDRIVAMPQNRPNPCNGAASPVVDSVVTSDTTSQIVEASGGVGGMKLGTMYNLGPTLTVAAYAVRGGQLTRCDLMDATVDCTSTTATTIANSWLPVGDGVVSLRAQYGRDTRATMSAPASSIVSQYDNLTPGTTADLAAVALASRPLVCRWVRIPAIRLALVTRNSQFEKNPVTDTTTSPTNGLIPAPSWDGQLVDSPTGSAANPITITGTNWQNYRYKTFQSTVPVRNVAWMGVPSGC